jgi:hypothetical protein
MPHDTDDEQAPLGRQTELARGGRAARVLELHWREAGRRPARSAPATSSLLAPADV